MKGHESSLGRVGMAEETEIPALHPKVIQKMRTVLVVLVLLSFTEAGVEAQLDPRYHTYEEMVAELDSLAALHWDIMRIDSIGVSAQDSMTIWAVKISDNVSQEEDEPAVLYNAVHHAEEVLGLEICIYMINDLVSRYGINSHLTWWVDNIEIWFVPLLNPEGHKVVTDGLDVTYRKNKRDNNGNGVFDFVAGIGMDIDGVDLNRNYDFYWQHGDTGFVSDYYRGSSPFSESENRALRDLAIAQKFVFAIFYHSARTGLSEVIYYPWCREGKNAPDFLIIKDTALTVASKIVRDDGLGTYIAYCTSSQKPFARNWFYACVGTLPVLIEVGSTIHPSGDRVNGICERNMKGAYYLLDRVLSGGITGRVTDAITGEPLAAEVNILEAMGGILSPRRCDQVSGRYHRILLPGSYTVEVSNLGYQKGRFSEIVVNPSRPTVLDVALTPLPKWNLSGTLVDALSNDPVEVVMIFKGTTVDTVCSDPSTGEYDLSLFEGSYLLDLVADGYVAGVDSLDLFGDTTLDYALYPAETLFTDDFEKGLEQWISGAPNSGWGISGYNCHSASHSMADSPFGPYFNGSDTWVAMVQGVDLTPYTSAALIFWHLYRFEPDFDSAYVEISKDGGVGWEQLGEGFSGLRLEWMQEVRSLDGYCGKVNDIKIRFRVVSDASVNDDGWHIDDVQILAGGKGVGIENHRKPPLPKELSLGQNYPNPFNSTTIIRYALPGVERRAKSGERLIPVHTTLKIYNLLGQEVRTLVNEERNAGYYTTSWDGRDSFGQEVGSGIYFYQLEAGNFVKVKKMVVLR